MSFLSRRFLRSSGAEKAGNRQGCASGCTAMVSSMFNDNTMSGRCCLCVCRTMRAAS